MKHQPIFRLMLCSILCCTALFANADVPPAMKQRLASYFENYKNPNALIDNCILTSVSVDEDNKTIEIQAGKGFQEQHFTDATVKLIYDSVENIVNDYYGRRYDIKVITDNNPIEDLVPNSLRSGKLIKDRLWNADYNGKPWVTNISRAFKPTKGLQGRHIALWQSHGAYFDQEKNTWKWQRPRLFCSAEDLLSQTFVLPYVIPMLENAGAIVYTPRDRDWQSNEVIVDNDAPSNGGMYVEGSSSKGRSLTTWHTSSIKGFAKKKDIYSDGDTPFSDGTTRYIATVKTTSQSSNATWIPDIPKKGRYAVYVTYQTSENSVDDARYTVYHTGGITEFCVNQQMGGGTWVYLGTFEFEKGTHDYCKVVLSNISDGKGTVNADAVRFGSGMGNVKRGLTTESQQVSGYPRWAEGARYYDLWCGMPKEIYTFTDGESDYRDDINTRSATVNYLSGGSPFNPAQQGKKVPFELSIAFHTDAGYRLDDSFFGSMAVYTTDFNDGKTATGMNRYVSRDLASSILTNLTTDLKKYKWKVRKLWNRNYSETREPVFPSIILEMLSHQNFSDMLKAYDPNFKFDFSRSVYKSIVKFIATARDEDYVIQPLPVHDFSAVIDEKHNKVTLSWQPTNDALEPTAKPHGYIVYTRKGEQGFDNGMEVNGRTATIDINPGTIYSFKVCACNKGGQSFPSETLSAYIAEKSKGTILIVNCFDRLSAPATINNGSDQGFDLDEDPGVQYGEFAGFCGRQICFSKKNIGSEATDGLGYSGSEYEGKVVMGNTFDYPYVHGKAIKGAAGYSFCSVSEKAFQKMQNVLSQYKVIDVIYGANKKFNKQTTSMLSNYCKNGGKLIVSGANIFKDNGLKLDILHTVYNGVVLDPTVTGVSGTNISFNIYRDLNAKCYSVPRPETLSAVSPAFLMMTYSNGRGAGVAYKEGKSRALTLGYPFETIKEDKARKQLMTAFLNFLLK